MALATIDTFEFDTDFGQHFGVVHISGNVYAIVYRGSGNDGWLITVEIDNEGNITEPIIDSFEFDTSNCNGCSIVHVSGDIYAIAYHKTNSGGWVITVDIDSVGQITEPVVDSLQLFSRPIGVIDTLTYIIHISGDFYAILGSDAGNNTGYLYTVEISTAGAIADSVTDSHRYSTNAGYYPEIIKVFQTVYAITYKGGWLKTLTIADNGLIAADPDLDILQYGTNTAYGASIVKVAGDIYAIAYNGADGDGWLCTVDIDNLGAIEDAVVDTLEFDKSACGWPHIIQLSEGYYAIAYGPSVGWLKTVVIESDGTIADAVSQSRYLGTCEFPFVFSITAGIVGIAYSGVGGDGWLATVGELPTVTTQAVTDILDTTATGNGNVTDLGSPNPTQHGVCWNTTGTPTTGDSKTEEGAVAATGAFTSAMTELIQGTKYYVRAYVVNTAGTAYGEEVEFTTPSPSASGGNPGVVELLT